MNLTVMPMAIKERRLYCIRFLDSAKGIVSGIEIQNRLSNLVFGVLGTGVRLAEVSLKFPYPLYKEEWAGLWLSLDFARRVANGKVYVVKFSTTAKGIQSGRTVLEGSFLTVTE